jgi:SAM-dependent methyltransferase
VAVLDLACGNLRFEKYLEQRFPTKHFHFIAVDNCSELIDTTTLRSQVQFLNFDIIAGLQSDVDLAAALRTAGIATSDIDLILSFGFLHHIPSGGLRHKFVKQVKELATESGASVALAFWQFLKDTRIAKSAEKSTSLALTLFPTLVLEQGDYLLGWRETEDVFRYCHSFSDAEVEDLSCILGNESTTFSADGSSDTLNRYIFSA